MLVLPLLGSRDDDAKSTGEGSGNGGAGGGFADFTVVFHTI